MYVVGIDGGGTKTKCVIADEKERIVGEGKAGPSNHQTCGIDSAKNAVQSAITGALQCAGLCMEDISYGVFGMSGADERDDFEILIPAVRSIMGKIPFQVVNDAWIGLYSGIEGGMGIVSICGTGAAHAGQNERGEKFSLRNLDYITGNCGGGRALARKALHYTFRSQEGTGAKSMLEEDIPVLFQADTLDDVCQILKHGRMTKEQLFKIPILVFELAKKGDEVCRKLIENLGYEEGLYGAAVIRHLQMTEEKVPVVLIGSLFQTGEPLLIDSYMKAVRMAAVEAFPVIPRIAPVMGAVRMALYDLKNGAL